MNRKFQSKKYFSTNKITVCSPHPVLDFFVVRAPLDLAD